MTEQEWLDSADPTPMLHFLQNRASARKLRLFAVWCCRQIEEFVKDDRSKRALDAAEGFADGTVSDEDRERHFRTASDAEADSRRVMETARDDLIWTINWQASLEYRHMAAEASAQAVADNPAAASELALRLSALTAPAPLLGGRVWDSVYALEQQKWVVIVRHIFGNPFRPYPAPYSWPSNVVQLAAAFYEGQDCGFALHDALLEAGHADLAQHFQEKDHPKGCWGLDLILGKE
jgi:hypothetical protein